MRNLIILILGFGLMGETVCAEPAKSVKTPVEVPVRVLAPATARAYIIAPQNGATVKSPFSVQFGLSGMGIAPAGVEKDNTGHHHLLIDVAELPAEDQPIPADEHHRHFGGGQTEVVLDLTPGKHTLQLLLADHRHIPHKSPVVSQKITIYVTKE